jgi:protein TonB
MLNMIKSKNTSKIKIALAIPFAIVTLFFFVNSVGFAKVNRKSINEISIVTQDTIKTKVKKLDEAIYFNVDEMPKFQGETADAFRVYIQKNLKYPEIAQKNGIAGRVFVQFDINSKGKVVNATVVRGADPDLDKEALRVVKSSPKWEPGLEEGKPVIVRYTFPISFSIK